MGTHFPHHNTKGTNNEENDGVHSLIKEIKNDGVHSFPLLIMGGKSEGDICFATPQRLGEYRKAQEQDAVCEQV